MSFYVRSKNGEDHTMFIDKARVLAHSGNGGNGMSSFRREKYVPRGGPSGGDGGRGGNVIFQADSNLNTLINFRYKRIYKAPNGENGGAKNCYGKDAEDLIISVPTGTLIYEEEGNKLLGDLTEDGQKVIALKGGRGGRGNSHFASSSDRAPTYSEKGEPGLEKWLRLELKVLADVGLIGFPSVGKSSLIRKVSGARPEVAAYHFTTLTPVLGVVNLDMERSFVMADIPGLIEGASSGTGLGHDFLRHIERTRVLIHVLDAAGSEGRDPKEDFTVINSELELYSPRLMSKQQIVAANKTDLIQDPEQLEDLRQYIEGKGYEFFPVCTLSGEGLPALLERVWEILRDTPPEEISAEEETVIYDLPKDEFVVERGDDGTFELKGRRIERLVSMTNFDEEQSLLRFQKIWRYMGLDKLLLDHGIAEGDTVRIYGVEFTYSK